MIALKTRIIAHPEMLGSKFFTAGKENESLFGSKEEANHFSCKQ
jgi:hypothetical protein